MPDEKSQLLTIAELSARSRLSLATIHRLKRDGKIPFFQPAGKGGRLLFPSDAIERAGAFQVDTVPPVSTPVPIEPTRLSGPQPKWRR